MGRQTVFYVAMGILATGLVLLFFNHEGGRTLGMDNHDFGRLVLLTSLFAVFGAAAIRRGELGPALRNALIWLVIIMALVTVYLYRHDLEHVAARVSGGLLPGTAITRQAGDGTTEIVIQRAMSGHFQARAEINGQPVELLVDTGATLTALSWADAERLDLEPATLAFNQQVMTANGMARAASVRLDELAIGPIVRHNVRATVLPEGALGFSLLGMNVLGELASFEMRRDELILRD